MSVHGNSLVDYFIVSKKPREFCESAIVNEKVISSHMPIEAYFKSHIAESYNVADNGIEQVTKSRFKWYANLYSGCQLISRKWGSGELFW